MQIISSNEPLLFVHGPPVYIHVEVRDEESTSVFVQNWEESTDSSDGDMKEIIDSSVFRRMIYLKGSFQNEVYRPLRFDLGDETLTGVIEKIEGNTAFIEIDGDEGIVAVEIGTIEEIYWRGKPFTEE